jgi:prephenate dehydratase
MDAAGLTVAFQGERGAFSEEAAARMLGARIAPSPQRTFEDMFQAVADGRAACALAPIENTLAGSIIKTYDLLVQHDLTIVGETVLRVVHNLIAPPGVTLGDVRRIYSHEVALAQCTRFLAALPDVQVIPAYDTAGSVKMIIAGGRRDEAAIASGTAAKIYDAAILAPGIESDPQNFTRFFLLARPDRAEAIRPRDDGRPRKTSIVFRVGHKPGALYRSLAAFADENIDLTKIESRPIVGRPWEYSFYLDFLGAPDDAGVARALSHLRGAAESIRLLGSYAKAE